MRLVHRRVRARIDEVGLRYMSVAQKIGLTPDRFAHIIDGRRPVPEPEAEFYTKLAAALFCAPEDIRESEELTVAA